MPSPPTNSGIRDNHYCGSVGDYLKPNIRDDSRMSVVSAYFTIYAYAALKEWLDRIGHMDFLFGEPSFVKSLDPAKTETKAFIIAPEGLKLANTLQQKRVARECADWIRQKVDIKTVCQTGFLHGKLYHVANNGQDAVAILGSSNFTPRGLGLQDTGSNIELNLIASDPADRDQLKAWFDRLWADPNLVKDVKADVLQYLAQVYQNHPPEFIYYKTLFHIFEKFLGDARKTDADLGATTLFDTEIWKALFDFQKDGVKGMINKILAHNGCILADSVGLGKTYEALAVIKFFELRNERVLVLCPKKLRDNWTVYRLNDKLNEEMEGYKLSLFNPSRYVKEEFKSIYQTPTHDPFTQADHETFLIGMMKVGFLKRLESSVRSFEITMDRTIRKIEDLERRISAFLAQSQPKPGTEELDLGLVDDMGDEDLGDAQQVGGKLKFNLKHLQLDRGKNWLKDLKKDKDQLTILHASAEAVTPDRDQKLAELKALIAEKARRPTTNKQGKLNRKVLVFTAFADTAHYLYEHIHEWALRELGIQSALVLGTGENKTTFQPPGFQRHTDYNHILTNFSPISKRRAKITSMSQEGEIDLLIATDCISEGQNLQDCDYVVNYDIHWNPVRIIQRFGRVDRIGSLNPTVQLVNFWPTPNLDRYISLKHRVEARMALVDIAATLEENLLQREELQDLIADDLRYRDRQLLRLKDEVLDLEDIEESISLTEFTLDDFRIDLLKYLETNRANLDAAPFGLYTVVPPHDQIKTIVPGVIWCLKQVGQASSLPVERASGPSVSDSLALPRGEGQGSTPSSVLRPPSSAVNPLQPYFLVYVLDDGNVRLGFAQPKQILGIYRELCVGKTTAYDDLCTLFDQQTADGSNTALYDSLLKKAVESIVSTFRKRVATGLQTGRSFKIPDQKDQANDTTDFELVTWLVIKKP